MSGWGDLAAKFAKQGWNCPGCLVTNDTSVMVCPCCETPNPSAPKGAAKSAAAAVVAPPPTGPISFGFGAPAPAAAASDSAAAAPALSFNFGFGAAPAAASSDSSSAPAPAAAFNFGFGAAPVAASSSSSSTADGTAAAPAPAFNFGFGAPAPAPASASSSSSSSSAEPAAVGKKKDKNAPHSFFNPSPFVAPVLPPGLSGPVDYEYNKPLPLAAAPAEAAAPPAAKKGRGGKKAAKAASSSSDESAAIVPASSSSSSAAAAAAGGVGVFLVGSGECDQLGLGDDTDTFTTEDFLLLKPLARLAVARIAAGGLHTLALTSDGRVWSWGCNDDLALGRGGAENRPGLVKGPLQGVPVVAIGAGDSHSVALDASGRVFAWGTYKGSDGYLGFDAHTKKQGVPRLMEGVATYGRAVSISCGADHTGIVTSDGLPVVWGYSGQGQLGKLTTERSLRGNRTAAIALTPYPIRIKAPKLKAVAAGAADGEEVQEAASSSSSSAAAAGKKRRRGADSASSSAASTSTTAPGGGLAASAIFCVGYSTYVATRDGRLFACGLNNYGQLGLGHTDNVAAPAEVTSLRGVGGGRGIVAMAGGAAHALALAGDGALYAVGRGDSGQLGLSGSAREAIPVAASAMIPVQINPARFAPPAEAAADSSSSSSASSSSSGCNAVVCISANTCSSAAVTADGRLFAWGFGESGQLGNGGSRDENVPYAVLPAGKGVGDMKGAVVRGVGMGGQHTAVLAAGGQALADAAAAIAGGTSDKEYALDEEPAKADDDDDAASGNDDDSDDDESKGDGDDGGSDDGSDGNDAEDEKGDDEEDK